MMFEQEQERLRESIIFDVQVLGISGNRWEPNELKTRLRALQNTLDEYNSSIDQNQTGGSWEEVPHCIVRVTDTTGHTIECHLMENKHSGKLLFNTSESPLTKEDPHEQEAYKLVYESLRELDLEPSYLAMEEMVKSLSKLANRVRFYNEHFAVRELHPTPHYFSQSLLSIYIAQKHSGKIFLLQDQTGKLFIKYQPGREKNITTEIKALFEDILIKDEY